MEDNYNVSPWSKTNNTDPLHSLCSYLGAFPPGLANYFIRYFTDEDDIVFDPFCGRGTTLLEARLLNRRSIGSDLNPIALKLSDAKSIRVKYNEILNRIEELESEFYLPLFLPESVAQSDEIRLIFHDRTLAELCYLRCELLESNSKVDRFILGALLGIMHGGERKDGSSGYLSISMPNTFSMSPDYVRRFVQTKNLNRCYRNVFKTLNEKVERIFQKHSSPEVESKVIECDAKQLTESKHFHPYKNKAKLVLTSPPYLGVVNYAKQNWIRSWLLDADPDVTSNKLDDDLTLTDWLKFSDRVIKQLSEFLADDGVAVLVIGDVAKSKNSVIPLARDFCRLVESKEYFKNVWVYSDYIKDKTTRIWGNTQGNATKTDRIVILSNTNPFKANKRVKKSERITQKEIFDNTKAFLAKVK
ncbi:MAG: DNA methyltransferase [Bacteroidota bacterium]